jgi:hypothetical protein
VCADDDLVVLDRAYPPDSLTEICTQTRPPDEVIVLEDSSTDNSLEIIEELRGVIHSAIGRLIQTARFVPDEARS